MLTPVSRYVETLQRIEDEKKQALPYAEVIVSLVSGTGTDGSVPYLESLDPTYNEHWGIGPGCSSSVGTAAPPARLDSFESAFVIRDVSRVCSICAEEWYCPIEPLTERLAILPPPSCIRMCLADQDPATPELDAACVVTFDAFTDAGITPTIIPECESTPTGPLLSESETTCWYLRSGEDAEDRCEENGWPELALLRAPDTFIAGGLISATCLVSPDNRDQLCAKYGY